MKRFIATLVALLSISTIALASPADAAVTRTAAAQAVTREQVYGPLYGRYKTQFPTLNWGTNGCSIPTVTATIGGPVGQAAKAYNAVAATYSSVFKKSCDRHDFGYRNHDLTGISRATVDSRFNDNMKKQCDVQYTDGLPPWLACRAAAKTMYTAVQVFGGSHW